MTYARSSRFACLTAIALGLALAAPAQAQTARDVDAIFQLAKRLAAAERASQDPIIVATETADVQSLITLYRTSPDTTLRDRAASALLTIGTAGPQRLLSTVHTEFKSKLKKYRSSFQEEVAGLVKKKRGGATPADIAALQAKITDLLKVPGLTKDQIVQDGDPALKKLEELLSIDRKTVFAMAPQLITDRKELAELSALAARAARQLPTAERKGEKVMSASELDAELAEYEELALFMVTPMKPEAQEVMFDNIAIAKSLDAEEAAGIQMLNLMRIRVGMQPLAIDLKLGNASRDHSKDMRTLGFFAHESPVSGKTTPWDRAKLAGTSAGGENIFYGSASHHSAIMAWWHSPGHFKNMMNPGFSRIGLGRVEGHWTQMFGG